MLTFSEWPKPEAIPMAATRHDDDHREVLVHVGGGAEEVVEIDVTNHFSKLPFCWPGSCQPNNSYSASDSGSAMCLSLQSRGNLWHPTQDLKQDHHEHVEGSPA